VIRPTTSRAGELLPILFTWHWLGGDPNGMVDALDLVLATEQMRFVAIVPEPKGDLLLRWPFLASDAQSRVDEEVAFFDAMLACVGPAVTGNAQCVSSLGVSAGALFTDQLVQARAARLASFVSLSGGTDGLARPWSGASRPVPALVLWGGPTDQYPSQIPLIHFDSASAKLEDGLAPEGGLLVECVHNCGHVVPPLEPPDAGRPRFEAFWQFVVEHPFWASPGTSVWRTAPPSTLPTWCALGRGNAVPRTGACP
jgi:hypothetical protein